MAWYGTISDVRHGKAAAIVHLELESVKGRFRALSGAERAAPCT